MSRKPSIYAHFQIPLYKILLSTETDKWAGQLQPFKLSHCRDTALDNCQTNKPICTQIIRIKSAAASSSIQGCANLNLGSFSLP